MRLITGVLASWLIWSTQPVFADLNPPRWERVETGVGDTAFVSLAVDPSAPNRIFVASRSTLYDSSDGGRNWQERFRVPASAMIRRVAAQMHEPPALLVATDQGLYGSFDGGAQWSRVFRGAGEGEAGCVYVAFHPTLEDRVLLATRGGLFVSSDRGRHWQEVSVPPAARSVVHFAFDSTEPDRVYLLAAGGLFAGSLTGGRWEQRLSVLGAEETAVEEPAAVEPSQTAEENGSLRRLSAIAIDPTHPATIYVGTKLGVFKSTDGAQSWTATTQGLTVLYVQSLVLDPNRPEVLYAGTNGGIFKTTDGAQRWTPVAPETMRFAIRGLAVDPQTPTTVFAATESGLFVSREAGASWQQVSLEPR